jgi:hypothetical protein
MHNLSELDDVIKLSGKNKEEPKEIAKLKKDSKAYLILSIGAAVFFGLLAINFVILSTGANTTFQLDIFLTGSTISVIIGVFFTVFFVLKIRGKREEITKLEEKYSADKA